MGPGTSAKPCGRGVETIFAPALRRGAGDVPCRGRNLRPSCLPVQGVRWSPQRRSRVRSCSPSPAAALLRGCALAWGGCLAAAFLLAAPAAAAPLSLETLLSRIQEAYDSTTDLKATFVQEITLRTMNRTEREEGTVYFKNPRRMLWDYLKPTPKKLVITAKQAWFYLPEDKVAYVQDAETLFRSRLAVRFFAGQGKLQEDFRVAFSSEGTVDPEGNHLLTLTPRGSDLGVDAIDIAVDPVHFLVSQCRFADAYGNVTRIRFRNIRVNTKLPERLFAFKPPPGVEVVNLP